MFGECAAAAGRGTVCTVRIAASVHSMRSTLMWTLSAGDFVGNFDIDC